MHKKITIEYLKAAVFRKILLYKNLIKLLLNKKKLNTKIDRKVELRIWGNFRYGKSLKIHDAGIDVTNICKIVVRENASLEIGNNCGISSSSIFCTHKIIIGNNVKIGAGCLLMDTDFHSLDWKIRRDPSLDYKNSIHAPICIDDDVFIGARSIICKGVHIGSKSIIAAGSVVACNIPNNQVWGGNPVKFIKNI